MKKSIKFSIIMPFYNSESYIERAILSVVNQTYDNWELIAVNDGSFDRSMDIVKSFANNDKRIRIIVKENGGYATAINCGLDNLPVDSDYFLMLGSDDALVQDVLLNLVRAVDDEEFDLVGFRTICIYPDGHRMLDCFSNVNVEIKETRTNIIDFYNKHNELPQLFIGRDTSRIYKTSLLGELRYFGKYGVSADGIFSMLFSYKCSSFAHLPFDGYLWFLRDDSVSSLKPNDFKKEDNFNNWRMFFTKVINEKYNLTTNSKKYIDYFVYSYINIVSVKNNVIFKRNKKYIYFSRKVIRHLLTEFDKRIPLKNRIKIYFPLLYRMFYKIKGNHRDF